MPGNPAVNFLHPGKMAGGVQKSLQIELPCGVDRVVQAALQHGLTIARCAHRNIVTAFQNGNATASLCKTPGRAAAGHAGTYNDDVGRSSDWPARLQPGTVLIRLH